MPIGGQGTGSTAPTASQILMTRYQKKVPVLIHRERPILALLSDSGSDNLDTRNKTTKFGHQVTRTNNQRWYGADDPEAYAISDGGMAFASPEVTYKKMYAAQRIKYEVMEEAAETGALADVEKRILEDVPLSVGADYERMFLQGKGDGVIAKVKNNETAGSAVTVEIDTLGNISGQEIGNALGNMSLKDFKVSWVTGGTLPQAIRHATADKISGYVETPGSEALVIETLSTNLTAGDLIILSRSDLGTGNYAAATHPTGLFGLVDNYGVLATFQGVTASTDSEFVSMVLDNGGTKEPITSHILSRMHVAAKVRATGMRTDGKVKAAYICATVMEEAIANLAEADRRFGFSQVFDSKGVKPYLGVDTEAMRHKGTPFFSSPLASPNSIFRLDTEDCFVVHNGPRWGQWVVRGHDLESGPGKQWVFMTYNDFGMWTRRSSVRRDDLIRPDFGF